MKTKSILSALVLSTVMTLFVACSKESEFFADPDQVIKSEVVDPGTAEEVTAVSNGTEGTSLSYESWIVVSQLFADGSTSKAQPKTRASSSAEGNKISVQLTNNIENYSSIFEVKSFELSDGVSATDYRELAVNKHAVQKFVSVIDSALVYTVNRGAFAIEFVLPYQVAVYNDGVTKVVMPYHKYSEIRDNGGSLFDLDNSKENGKNYLQKLYKHSLTVVFNGKEYAVNAEVVLKKELKDDYLVSQKVVDSGVELVSYDLEKKTGVSKSWIKIEETWSESGTKTVTKEVLLKNMPSEYSYVNFSLGAKSKIAFADLVIGSPEYSDALDRSRTEGDMTINTYERIYRLNVKSTANEGVNYVFGVMYEKAVYAKNGFEYEMPALQYSGADIAVSLKKDWYSQENHEQMDLQFVSTIGFGKVSYVYSAIGYVLYYGKK